MTPSLQQARSSRSFCRTVFIEVLFPLPSQAVESANTEDMDKSCGRNLVHAATSASAFTWRQTYQDKTPTAATAASVPVHHNLVRFENTDIAAPISRDTYPSGFRGCARCILPLAHHANNAVQELGPRLHAQVCGNTTPL